MSSGDEIMDRDLWEAYMRSATMGQSDTSGGLSEQAYPGEGPALSRATEAIEDAAAAGAPSIFLPPSSPGGRGGGVPASTNPVVAAQLAPRQNYSALNPEVAAAFAAKQAELDAAENSPFRTGLNNLWKNLMVPGSGMATPADERLSLAVSRQKLETAEMDKQFKVLHAITASAKEFNQMSDENQAKFGPALSTALDKAMNGAGMPGLGNVFVPGVPVRNKLMGLASTNDPLVPRALLESHFDQMSRTKDPIKQKALSEDFEKDAYQYAENAVVSVFPDLVAKVKGRMGLSQDAEISESDFLAMATKLEPGLAGVFGQKALRAITAKDGPTKQIINGEIASARLKKAGETKHSELQTRVGRDAIVPYILSDPRWIAEKEKLDKSAGRTLTDGEAYDMMPSRVRGGIVQDGNAAFDAKQLQNRGEGARVTVVGTDAAKRAAPMIQHMPKDVVQYRDKQTGNLLDKYTTSLDDFVRAGGTQRFAEMNEKREDAYRQIIKARGFLSLWREAVNGLSKEEWGNWGKALEAKLLQLGGSSSLSVGIEALGGTVLQIAAAFQGSSQNLSDNDKKSVEAMFATIKDGYASATQRLDTFEKILHIMEAGALDREANPIAAMRRAINTNAPVKRGSGKVEKE